jgi:hypothetical protein
MMAGGRAGDGTATRPRGEAPGERMSSGIVRREGGCFCGATRFAVSGEPGVVAHCHCLHCRRISGAAFVTWATFPLAAFAWQRGTPAAFASRPGVQRTFCTSCGTPLTFEGLDEPESVRPQSHVFASRLLSWAETGDRLPRFALSRREG